MGMTPSGVLTPDRMPMTATWPPTRTQFSDFASVPAPPSSMT